jgi:rRNA maturation protein Nop10
MLFHEQPTDPWNKYDFKLLEAFQILQDETCPQCGNPVWLCHSSSNRVDFKAYETICHATVARMRREDSKKPRDQRAKSDERKEWGRTTTMIPFKPDAVEGDLPTRREYYEELNAVK